MTESLKGPKSRASTGNLRQRKENQTPLERRSQFVKPQRQVFADFGVQVFAPLPRTISPERELPPPSQPAEVRTLLVLVDLENKTDFITSGVLDYGKKTMSLHHAQLVLTDHPCHLCTVSGVQHHSTSSSIK